VAIMGSLTASCC